MPAPIPDRYRLEVRLGRDHDVEEWLATDTSLERPVLIRALGPETTRERRARFVAMVGAAAQAAHPHLARVFAVEEVAGGAYSVCEWTGGSTLGDRVAAGQPIELDEFLPNAAGLAGALAALHDAGAVHGRIDLSAVSYTAAHPAKLGAFGRPADGDATADVRALAASLETALTGSAPGGPPPSESIDGVHPAIDVVLRTAQSGDHSAHSLEKALASAPTPRPPRPEPQSTSRRLLLAAIVLVALAAALVALGRVLSGGGPPLVPPPTTTSSTLATTTTTRPGPVGIAGVSSFDPFGEGGENDGDLPAVVDGSAATSWATERYQAPLAAIKPGVGLVFAVEGTPGRLQLLGFSPGTVFSLHWSAQRPPDPSEWERIAEARSMPGATIIDLPPRTGGNWLLWLITIPESSEGGYQAEIAEVRFDP